ncbi:adenylate cyclase, class 2 [Anaerolineales bacterium]|nr:adenylate cyclase, class 2 [Anaerolineales bacterium]
MSFLNIEIKAKFLKTSEVDNYIHSLNFTFEGNYKQTDTYFNVNFGRLKLRQQSPGSDCLIFYDRENKILPKESKYQIVNIGDAGSAVQLLSAAMGVLVIVKKKREFWRWKNVRVFFDQVENLGSFIEFEAVCKSEEDIIPSRENVNYLMTALNVKEEDLVATSYSDLIMSIKT